MSCGRGEGLPSCRGAGEIVGGQDGSGGYCQELIVGHWEGSAGKLTLCLFEHHDELADAIAIGIIVEHVGGEANKLTPVEAAAVCIEVVEELLGRDVGVEGVGVV